MRVALITPHFPPSTRGNAITVDRIARGLAKAGHAVEVRSPAGETLSGERLSRADIVHAFHALQTGPAGLKAARALDATPVVTVTGTDFNEDLDRPECAEKVRRVLDAASAIVAFTRTAADELVAKAPSARARIRVIPQAPSVEGWPRPAEIPGRRRPDAFTLLSLGGIRPVKATLYPVSPCDRLRGRLPGLRLLFVGPVLDRAYADRFFSEIRRRPWTSYAGELAHASVPAILAGVDAVLNTSHSEGGMPNSLLEAMWWGRPVVAHDIPGNRELVEHGETGLLFADESGFNEAVLRLATDEKLSRHLVENGWRLAREQLSPEREIASHVEMYASVARGRLPGEASEDSNGLADVLRR